MPPEFASVGMFDPAIHTEVDSLGKELPNRVWRHRDFDFFLDEHRVVTKPNGLSSVLTLAELDTLMLLGSNPNRYINALEIALFCENSDQGHNKILPASVPVIVLRLRDKLGQNDDKLIIESKVGLGYRLIDLDRLPRYQEVELDENSPALSVLGHQFFKFVENSQEIIVGGNKTSIAKFKLGKLLGHFMKHPNMIQPRDQLIGAVWSQDRPNSRTVDLHVSWLRKELKRAGIREEVIETVWGVGYRLVDESKLPPQAALVN